MIKLEKTYELNEANIDLIAEDVMNVCDSIKMRKDQSLKIRLIIEDALAVWLDKLGSDTLVKLKSDTLFWRPYIKLSTVSEYNCNPLLIEENGFFSSSIMKTLVSSPDFGYQNGENVLHFNLPREELNPVIKLLIVIACALLVGFLGLKIISAEIIGMIQENIIAPTYSKFLDVLRCIAGPLMFFSVAWGIYGIGDTSTLSRIGKGLCTRYIRQVFIATAQCIVFFPIFKCILSGEAVDFRSLISIYSMFMDMIPVSIVEPFLTGNTLQIIVLAICVGIAMIFLGKRTRYVAVGIEQFNMITTFLMTAISKLVPVFIAIVLINMIWSGSLSVLTNSWVFIIALMCELLFLMLLTTFISSLRYKVSMNTLIKKITPVYLIALVTASSSASFASLVDTCEKKFGISESLTSFGVPLGIVMFKMASAINSVMLAFYIAGINNIECSVSWIVMAIIVSAIVAIATPPIPGGGVIAYTMLFTQLGLPEDSLAIALALDMLTDFLITSSNIYCLPLGLTDVAARYGLLDKNVLKSENV